MDEETLSLLADYAEGLGIDPRDLAAQVRQAKQREANEILAGELFGCLEYLYADGPPGAEGVRRAREHMKALAEDKKARRARFELIA